MGPPEEWIYTRQVKGTSDGGSSGSAATIVEYNASGVPVDAKFVGQMYGGCGWTSSNTCTFDAYYTVFGALSGYFNQVSPWLDPSTAVTTTTVATTAVATTGSTTCTGPNGNCIDDGECCNGLACTPGKGNGPHKCKSP